MSYLAKPLTLTLAFCSPLGVYLRWLSWLGTWEGFFFPGDIDDKTEVTDATDLSTADNRATVAVRRAGTDTLTVRVGDLSEAQHQVLSTLIDSPQVYRQYANGQRVPVLVAASATATRTSSDGRYTFDLDIKLPARNALTH